MWRKMEERQKVYYIFTICRKSFHVDGKTHNGLLHSMMGITPGWRGCEKEGLKVANYFLKIFIGV